MACVGHWFQIRCLLMSVGSVIRLWKDGVRTAGLASLSRYSHCSHCVCWPGPGSRAGAWRFPAVPGSSLTRSPGPSECQRPETWPGDQESVVLRPPLLLQVALYLPRCSELLVRTPQWGHAWGPAGQPMPARQAASCPWGPTAKSPPPCLAAPLGSLSLSPATEVRVGFNNSFFFFFSLISGVRLKTTNVKFLFSLTHALSGY